MVFNNYIVKFIIVFSIHNFVCESLKRSLTFVIDDTFSMDDDIDQVKLKTAEVFDAVLNSSKSEIEDLILVTFNDPGVIRRVKTRQESVFKEKLNEIEVHDGDDCPELALEGIKLGIEESRPHSLFYVFTDATAKDIYLYDEVQSMALKKFIQVTFLLTGDCGQRDSPNYEAYTALSKVTKGQVLNIHKDEVKKVMDFVIQTIKDKNVNLYNQNFPAGSSEDILVDYHFSVDSKVHSITCSLVGDNYPSIVVTDSHGDVVSNEVIVQSKEAYIMKINQIAPGNYTAAVKSTGHSILVIKASTQLSFQYGFPKLPPASKEDSNIVPRPVAGEKSYLGIDLSNDVSDVELESAEILDLNGNVLKTMPLRAIKKGKFYVIDEFISPSFMFTIAVNGIHTPTKEKIRRNSDTAVLPWNKNIVTGSEKEVKAKITKLKINSDVASDNIQIICNVDGYPKPDIVLVDAAGASYTGKTQAMDVSSYVSVFESAADKNNTFVCKATNSLGLDEKSIDFTCMKQAPVIDKSVNEYYVDKGKSLEVICRVIRGEPKPSISWTFKPLSSTTFTQLPNTEEIISKQNLNKNDTGIYTCKAMNIRGFMTFDIKVYVRYPPNILTPEGQEPSSEIVAVTGDNVLIDCDVDAYPDPDVRWYSKGREIVNGGRHIIYSNNTLGFIATTEDNAEYKCEASNSLGEAKREVQVNINAFIPASIKPPLKRVYELKIGDSVSLDCVAEGIPKPTVTWTFKPFIGCCEKGLSATSDNNTYAMDYVIVDQAGSYICTAQNRIDDVKLYYEVYIEAPPLIVNELMSKKFKAVVGDLYLKIPCNATGHPKPDILWLANELPIVLGDGYNVVNGTLIITEISDDVAGSYKCVVSNKLGTANDTFDVEVSKSPDIEARTVQNKLCIIKNKISDIECKVPHGKLDLVRWFKGKTLLSTINLSLYGVASDLEIYTCRVSNFFGSKNYQVEINLCSAPAFITNEQTTIDYVEGMSIHLRCTSSGYPTPQVSWTHNHMRLRDTNMDIFTYQVGTLTCDVSNEYGEISRTFNIVAPNCTIDIMSEFAKPEPLLLNKIIETPSFEIKDYKVNIQKNETIFIYCDKSYLEYRGQNLGKSINAVCDKNSIFKTSSQALNYKDIKCHEPVIPFYKDSKIKCSNTTLSNNTLIQVGYKVLSKFLSIYDVCLDIDKQTPIHVRSFVERNYAGLAPSIDYRSHNMELDYDSMYDCDNQQSFISKSTGTNFYGKGCFEIQQLVNAKYLFPGMQAIAFHYINVEPQWNQYKANWAELDRRVHAKALDQTLIVMSGVYDELTVLNPFGINTNILLSDKKSRTMAVPKYFWKMVYDGERRAAVAIIQVNSPNIASRADAERFVLCKDICDEIGWLTNPDWKDYTKGYTYCCTYTEFTRRFLDICFIRDVDRVLV